MRRGDSMVYSRLVAFQVYINSLSSLYRRLGRFAAGCCSAPTAHGIFLSFVVGFVLIHEKEIAWLFK
jgi:hypothetical protein